MKNYPDYMGIIDDKDHYKPANRMACHRGFERCSLKKKHTPRKFNMDPEKEPKAVENKSLKCYIQNKTCGWVIGMLYSGL